MLLNNSLVSPRLSIARCLYIAAISRGAPAPALLWTVCSTRELLVHSISSVSLFATISVLMSECLMSILYYASTCFNIVCDTSTFLLSLLLTRLYTITSNNQYNNIMNIYYESLNYQPHTESTTHKVCFYLVDRLRSRSISTKVSFWRMASYLKCCYHYNPFLFNSILPCLPIFCLLP